MTLAPLAACAALAAAPQDFGPDRLLDHATSRLSTMADIDGDGLADAVRGVAEFDLVALDWKVNFQWAPNLSGGRFGALRLGVESAPGSELDRLGRALPVDLDGDGALDVVTVNASQFNSTRVSAVSVFRGTGSGTFEPELRIYGGADLFVSASTGDVDGDGDVDVILERTDEEVLWLENEGGAPIAFAAPASITGAGVPVRASALFDADGDGDLDLAAVVGPAESLQIAINGGGGVFGPLVAQPVAPISRLTIVPGDVDRDGDVDLLATLEAQDEVVWYENDGTGTFLARRTLGATLDRPRGIAFADVDDDGIPDVHYGSVGVDNTSWFRGLGGGSYAPSQALVEDVSAIASASLGVADIDGDGALEPWADGLIVDGPAGGGDGVRWTDTDGPPSAWTTSTVGTPFRLVTGTTALDADGDGLPEVAVTSIRGVVVLGNEPVGAEFGTEQLVATFADSGSSPQSADLDGDGAADVLITLGQFSGTHGIYVAYGDGAGGFGPLETVGLTAPAFTETGFRTADLEGDGDLDVLVTDNFFTSEARWFVNEGARTFSEGPFFGVPIARNATVLDLDGDGAAELVQVSGSCALEYLDGAPGGLFDPPVVVANCASGIGARAGDVTGDGLVDLVLFDNDLGVFGYLPGLGGGAFGATVTIAPSNGGTPQGILVGDVDLDGNLDIVASQDDEAFWVPNAGGGSFGAPRPLTLALGPLRGDAQLVDLDGDGDLDLLNGAAFLLNDALLGARSCTAGAPNSTGERGTLTAVGSASTLDNDLSLIAGELPAGEFGMFLVAPVGASVPNPGGSQGTLCLGGSIGRFNRPTEIQQASAAGTIRLRVDLTNVPNGPGSESLVPGDTRFFQLWHRDTGLGAPAGFTAGLRVEFR